MHQLKLFESHQQQKKSILPKKRQDKIKNLKNNNDLNELKTIHHTHFQFRDTVENAEKYIQQLSRFSLDKLSRNLDIIREQMQYAFENKNYASYELLYEWEKQAIIARLVKFDKAEKNNSKKIISKILSKKK